MNATPSKPVIGKAGLSAIAGRWPQRKSHIRQAIRQLATILGEQADEGIREQLERADAEALLAELHIVELENRLIAQAMLREATA